MTWGIGRSWIRYVPEQIRVIIHAPDDVRVAYDPEVPTRRTAGAEPDEDVLGPPQPDDPIVLRLASPAGLTTVAAHDFARQAAIFRQPRLRLSIERADEISYATIANLRMLAREAEVREVVVHVRQRG